MIELEVKDQQVVLFDRLANPGEAHPLDDMAKLLRRQLAASGYSRTKGIFIIIRPLEDKGGGVSMITAFIFLLSIVVAGAVGFLIIMAIAIAISGW